MRTSIVIVGLVLVLIAFSGCTTIQSREDAQNSNQLEGMIVTDTIQKGNYVTLYYTGTLSDGNIFDATQPGSPATFQVGVGGLIEGFDNGLLGMKIGEKKHIEIPAAQAYGEINAQAIQSFPTQTLMDANIPVKVGITVNTNMGSGKIIEVNSETNTVKIDFNHPLAGKDLIFDVEIVSISATP